MPWIFRKQSTTIWRHPRSQILNCNLKWRYFVKVFIFSILSTDLFCFLPEPVSAVSKLPRVTCNWEKSLRRVWKGSRTVNLWRFWCTESQHVAVTCFQIYKGALDSGKGESARDQIERSAAAQLFTSARNSGIITFSLLGKKIIKMTDVI